MTEGDSCQSREQETYRMPTRNEDGAAPRGTAPEGFGSPQDGPERGRDRTQYVRREGADLVDRRRRPGGPRVAVDLGVLRLVLLALRRLLRKGAGGCPRGGAGRVLASRGPAL